LQITRGDQRQPTVGKVATPGGDDSSHERSQSDGGLAEEVENTRRYHQGMRARALEDSRAQRIWWRNQITDDVYQLLDDIDHDNTDRGIRIILTRAEGMWDIGVVGCKGWIDAWIADLMKAAQAEEISF
jgi:hypothetical protein